MRGELRDASRMPPRCVHTFLHMLLVLPSGKAAEPCAGVRNEARHAPAVSPKRNDQADESVPEATRRRTSPTAPTVSGRIQPETVARPFPIIRPAGTERRDPMERRIPSPAIPLTDVHPLPERRNLLAVTSRIGSPPEKCHTPTQPRAVSKTAAPFDQSGTSGRPQ